MDYCIDYYSKIITAK